MVRRIIIAALLLTATAVACGKLSSPPGTSGITTDGTLLTIGTIADESVFFRSGTSVVGAIRSVATIAPAAASTDGVHANFSGATVSTSFPGAFTALDVERGCSVTFDADWSAGDVTVTGTYDGAAQNETVADVAGTTVQCTKLFDTITSAVKETAGVIPTGTITCVAKASHVDGETVTIDDGVNAASVFEFDVAGDGVGGGNVQVNISGSTSAADVCTVLHGAINGVGAGLAITSTDASGSLTLANDQPGSDGNVNITETVTDGSFAVTGMSGGVGDGLASIGRGTLIGTGDSVVTASLETYIRLDATNGEFNWQVPLAASHDSTARQIVYKKIDSGGNIVTLTRASTNTIEGGTSLALSVPRESVTLFAISSSAWEATK